LLRYENEVDLEVKRKLHRFEHYEFELFAYYLLLVILGIILEDPCYFSSPMIAVSKTSSISSTQAKL
jgi:hypothetical protein